MTSTDFIVKTGESITLRFDATDSDGESADLTNAQLTFTMKQGLKCTPVVTKQTSSFDRTNASKGTVRISLVATDTTSLQPGDYYFEFKADMGAGNVHYSPTMMLSVEQSLG